MPVPKATFSLVARGLRAAAPLLLILLAVATPAQEAPPGDPLLQARGPVLREALVGTWRNRVGDESLVVSFQSDGRLRLPGRSGRWRVDEGGRLVLELAGDEGLTGSYTATIASGQLTLAGGGLGGNLALTRDPALSHLFARWFGLDATSGHGRWWRVVGILLWIAAARAGIWAVHGIGRTLILSRRGPLRRLFPHQPLRAATLLSLSLNTAKYVIYAIGLGFVLSTFDVDYTTYLASLSVIGLAIGFGSQGLVQDMVTGMFILLENQFDVGDIVEVSGQTGVVEEMGLRMTRLRTIQGQQVTVPNRSIATVARYGPQGLRVECSAELDASADTQQVRERADACLRAFATQFPAAVLAREPAHTPSDEDERQLLRVDLYLWPGQQALLDSQLLPRLRRELPVEDFPRLHASLAWHFDRPRIEPGRRGGWRRWFARSEAPPSA